MQRNWKVMATIVSKRSGSVRGVEGNVDKILSALREKSEKRLNSVLLQRVTEEEAPSQESGKKGKVVLYVTSVQVVKHTHDLCRQVAHCLRARRVSFTTKDVFLHPNYGEELSERMGGSCKNIELPQLFINGEYIGDGEMVLELNECGELEEMLQGFTQDKDTEVCALCGGKRFILCLWCQGSKRGIRNTFNDLKCTVCNENGLQMCPNCCM